MLKCHCILFLFSGFFGLPLFLRKLYPLGFLFVILWIVNFGCAFVLTGDDGVIATSIMQLIFLGLAIWLGIKGNEITAKNYLENGYVWNETNDDVVQLAKGKWGLQ